MEKKRYANIDLLKTIAIFMVICLHSQVFNTDFIGNPKISSYVQYGIRILCEGVAIFVLVNGFLLINKKEFCLKKHLQKTLKIFMLLIIWSLILTISIKIIYKEPLKISEIFKNVFVTDITNKYTGVLWFLQNLIMVYLIYPVLKTVHDNDKKIYNYLFILLLISTSFINILDLISQLINTKYEFEPIRLVISYISKFQVLYNRNFLVFFMLGGYLFENKEKFEMIQIRKKWILIGSGTWLISYLFAIVISNLQNKTYSETFNYASAFMPVILIGMYAITYTYQNKEKWYNKLIENISKNTLGIYLIHIIVVRILNLLFVGNVSLILRVIKVILVFAISYILTLIIKKIPKLNKLIEL